MEELMLDLFGEPIAEKRKPKMTGKQRGIFSSIGATTHSLTERQSEDFYATDPSAVEMLLELETFSHKILEPSCGAGHIGKVLEDYGHEVDARDLVYRGYGRGGLDFLKCEDRNLDADCVMNPPYSLAQEFVEKAMEVIGEGHKIAAILKLIFLEGKRRREMFQKYPPKTIWVSSSRLSFAKNGTEYGQSCICFAWFIWEKGFKGKTTIDWFN